MKSYSLYGESVRQKGRVVKMARGYEEWMKVLRVQKDSCLQSDGVKERY